MQTFLVVTGGVVLAEIGDKTQLLALLLTVRLGRPFAVIAGITVATLVNHGIAALIGTSLTDWIDPEILRWVLGVSFVAMGLWVLKPDSMDDDPAPCSGSWGAFVATLVPFFLIEIGDKTQIATVALAAAYDDLVLIVAASTLGMLLANVPVVLLGKAAMERLPLDAIRYAAATVFVLLGVAILLRPAWFAV